MSVVALEKRLALRFGAAAESLLDPGLDPDLDLVFPDPLVLFPELLLG